MNKFMLVVNTTADETAAYYQTHDIKYAPLSFTIGGKTIAEDCGQTMPFPVFYENLRKGNMSSTAQAQPAQYLAHFRAACAAGHDVLYLGFSSGLSGSFDAGCMAAKEVQAEYPDRVIRCVDSLSATGGEAILVEKARALRDMGKTADEAALVLEDLRFRVIHLITVNDLNHLWRGGRVSRSSAMVGGLLGIKPMIYVNNAGKLEVCNKIRGRKKAMEHLHAAVVQQITDRTVPVRINHGDCLEDAQALAALLAADGIDSKILYAGTVIGSHAGPGLLTAFFVGSERKPF